jgi:nucleolin
MPSHSGFKRSKQRVCVCSTHDELQKVTNSISSFGYVDFETTAAATKAIETLNQQLFEGRRLAVQYAAYSSRQLDNDRSGFPRSDRPQKPLNPPSKTLFIGNMSFEMTDRDLNALFRGIKNVIDVRVAIDRRTGQPRGFAHADFIDVKSAMEAMKVLETKETYGRKLRLDYSYGPSNAPKNQFGADKDRGQSAEDRGDSQDNFGQN